MSFDLFLYPCDAGAFDRRTFQRFFGDRENYQLMGDEQQQAWYSNSDTGVYFSFEWSAGEGSDDPEDPAARPHIAFNLNLFRPDYFSQEAASELDAVVVALSPEIYDPQFDGMGRGPYSHDGFLRSWRSSNASAHRALQNDPDVSCHLLSASKNEAMQRWNLGLKDLNDALHSHGHDVFAPHIVPLALAGDKEVRRGAVWTSGMSFALPEAIDVLLLAEEKNPRRIFGIPVVGGENDVSLLGAVFIDTLPFQIPQSSIEIDGRTVKVIGSEEGQSAPQVATLYDWARNNAVNVEKGLSSDEVLDQETFDLALASVD